MNGLSIVNEKYEGIKAGMRAFIDRIEGDTRFRPLCILFASSVESLLWARYQRKDPYSGQH